MPVYEHSDMLKRDFDIEVSNLGCVMLDVEPLKTEFIIPEEWEYHSEDPKMRYVKGRVEQSHVTLLYGLLRNANEIRPAVNRVLRGWEPETVVVDEVGFFPAINDEPYSCIIAHIKTTENLLDAHYRLSYLPHIDTHPGYKPHVTLAYVKKNFQNAAVTAFSRKFNGAKLTPKGLNYGRK